MRYENEIKQLKELKIELSTNMNMNQLEVFNKKVKKIIKNIKIYIKDFDNYFKDNSEQKSGTIEFINYKVNKKSGIRFKKIILTNVEFLETRGIIQFEIKNSKLNNVSVYVLNSKHNSCYDNSIYTICLDIYRNFLINRLETLSIEEDKKELMKIFTTINKQKRSRL